MARLDLSALLTTRAALLPLPVLDRHTRVRAAEVLPPLAPRPVEELEGKRIGLIAPAGGVALVGVARAFEEAGIRPAAMTASSASVLWAAMWAGGLTAEQMGDLSLAWRPERHLGIQWTGVPRFAVSALRGFGGLRKAEALEQLFDRRVWHMSAGTTDFPLRTVAYNLRTRDLEYFGTRSTPELTIGEIARVAVAGPGKSDAIRIEGELYVDGAFAGGTLGLDGDDLDHVFAIDEDVNVVEPQEPPEMRPSGFYGLFLNHAGWPELMRRGYDATVEALRPFRTRAVKSRGGSADRGRGTSAR